MRNISRVGQQVFSLYFLLIYIIPKVEVNTDLLFCIFIRTYLQRSNTLWRIYNLFYIPLIQRVISKLKCFRCEKFPFIQGKYGKATLNYLHFQCNNFWRNYFVLFYILSLKIIVLWILYFSNNIPSIKLTILVVSTLFD